MKERMQLVGSVNESAGRFSPVLVVYNSMGHRLGKFVAEDSTSDKELAMIASRSGVKTYDITGRMVYALEAISAVISNGHNHKVTSE
jgi:hypothetical protein